MPAIADLKEDLDDLTTLKFVSSAFTEASAAKIKNIRNAFERNKQFWEEVSYLYHMVKISAVQAKRKGKGKEKEQVSEGKTLSVALTSNQRFYGSININIMTKYIEEVEKQKTELLVIGNTGIEYMHSQLPGKPYKTMIFSRETPDQEEIHRFLESIKEYAKIFVYYPKFETLLTQTVGIVDITQTATKEEKESKEEIHFLFEPELSMMLDFFEDQIRALLFLRVMLETNLSRTAARLISMSAAEERADEMMKQKKSEIRKAQTSFANAKLLETFAGIKKWKK